MKLPTRSIGCKHGNHVDIIEKEWKGEKLLISVCESCKKEFQEILK